MSSDIKARYELLMDGFISIRSYAHSGQQPSYKTKQVHSFWVTESSESVEWISPFVPEHFSERDVTFVVACGFGAEKKKAATFDLMFHFNGDELISINGDVEGDREWKEGSVSAFFNYLKKDEFGHFYGLLYITIPKKKVQPGTQVTFQVTAGSKQKNCWFFLNNCTNIVEFNWKAQGKIPPKEPWAFSNIDFTELFPENSCIEYTKPPIPDRTQIIEKLERLGKQRLQEVTSLSLEQWKCESKLLRESVRDYFIGTREECPLNARVTGNCTINGFRVEKIYFDSAPQIHIPALLLTPREAKGPLPVIIWLHGTFYSKEYVARRWAGDLANSGFSVMMIDYPFYSYGEVEKAVRAHDLQLVRLLQP